MELPFTAKLPEYFGIGSRLIIEAKPKGGDDTWFSLTLFEDNQVLSNKYDEADNLGLFQLELRFDEGIAVFNSIGPGPNNTEEQREELNLDKDEKVRIEIRATENKFKVFLNDDLFARFHYREDINRAKFINIYGGFCVKKLAIKKKD